MLKTHSPASSLRACPPVPLFSAVQRQVLLSGPLVAQPLPLGYLRIPLPRRKCSAPVLLPPSGSSLHPATSAEVVGLSHTPHGVPFFPFLPPQPGSPAIALFPAGPVTVCQQSLTGIPVWSPFLPPRLQSPGCVIYP